MAPGAVPHFKLSKHMSLRAGPVEYLLTNFREATGGDGLVQNNLRVSAGLRWWF